MSSTPTVLLELPLWPCGASVWCLVKLRGCRDDNGSMATIVDLDVMLAWRKVRSKELSCAIGITEQQVSPLTSGEVKGARFETLKKICVFLECQPGNLLRYEAEEAE